MRAAPSAVPEPGSQVSDVLCTGGKAGFWAIHPGVKPPLAYLHSEEELTVL